MEKISFYTLASVAYKKIFIQKTPWIFGSVLALTLISEDKVFSSLKTLTSLEEVTAFLSRQSFESVWPFLLITLLLALVHAFGQGNLITSLQFLIEGKKFAYTISKRKTLIRSTVILFLIETILFSILLGILGILSLPLFLASFVNTSALPLLTNLLLLTLLFFILLFSLLKQFIFCYALFSPLSLRSAFKLSVNLFYKHTSISIFFFIFTLFLSTLFTFFVNIAILGIVAIVKWLSLPLTQNTIEIFCLFAFFAGFSVFLQALWILFFASIAKSKDEPKEEKERVSASEQIAPDVPQI